MGCAALCKQKKQKMAERRAGNDGGRGERTGQYRITTDFSLTAAHRMISCSGLLLPAKPRAQAPRNRVEVQGRWTCPGCSRAQCWGLPDPAAPCVPPGVLQLPAPSTRPARGTGHRICCIARSLCCAQPEAREWPLRHNSTRNFCPSVLGELPAPLPAGKGSPGRGVWSYSPISTPFIHWHHLKQALASRNLCARSTLQPLSPPGTSSPLHRHL